MSNPSVAAMLISPLPNTHTLVTQRGHLYRLSHCPLKHGSVFLHDPDENERGEGERKRERESEHVASKVIMS